jgi:hypothetical protein
MLRGRTALNSAVSIEGDRPGFEALARLLRVGSGRVALTQRGDPWPYAQWLSAIVVAHTASEHVHIGFSSDWSELVVTYPAELSDTLAWNFGEYMANSAPNSHLHEEFFPDHPYLDASAEPLVLERLPD